MIINSVYTTQDSDLALSQFEVREDKSIVLLKLWRQTDDKSLPEILTADKDAINLFNGVQIGEKLSSAFAERVRRLGVSNIKIAEPFRYLEGRMTYISIRESQGVEISEECKRWAKLAEQFNREGSAGTPEQMAFLQGIDRAHKEASRPSPTPQSTPWIPAPEPWGAPQPPRRNSQTAAERMGFPEPRRFGTPPL